MFVRPIFFLGQSVHAARMCISDQHLHAAPGPTGTFRVQNAKRIFVSCNATMAIIMIYIPFLFICLESIHVGSDKADGGLDKAKVVQVQVVSVPLLYKW